MAAIQKRKNKNGTTSYRVMIRPNDGLPPTYKTWPTYQEAKDWAIQEEARRRQGIYFPEKQRQRHTLTELIERYVGEMAPSKPASEEDIIRHLNWRKNKIGQHALNHITPDLIAKHRKELLDEQGSNGKQTSCNYGGSRHWFLCPPPKCQRRCKKLYLCREGVFVCRHCLNLAYKTQNRCKLDRIIDKKWKLIRQLGADSDIFIQKPKHMHQKTFEQLWHQIESLDHQANMGIFEKTHYSHVVTPALRMLKFATFGHDMVVLHEQDIRKKLGAFNKLSKEPREAFLNALSTLMAQCNFTVIPIVIDKHAIKTHGLDPIHVYHSAMRLGLETLHQLLMNYGQHTRLTHVVFEARGQKEDAELELEFRRVCDYNNFIKQRLPFEIVISDKKTNSEGLQFADIIARPIGLSVLKPEQANRAFTILRDKLYQDHESFVYPLKAKDPKVVLEVQTPVG